VSNQGDRLGCGDARRYIPGKRYLDLATFIGHTSITVTLDRYGHLFPGSEQEAAGLLDSYLERSVRRAEQ
jgi:hypothetical protein